MSPPPLVLRLTPLTVVAPITTYQFLIFLCGDHVIFTVHGSPPLEQGGPTKAEYTVKLEALAHWDRLDDEDLRYDNVRRVTSSPPYIQELQERLRRKRYIDNATEDVRVIPSCCRPSKLGCSSLI